MLYSCTNMAAVNGKWLPDFIERLKAFVSFVYRSYHLPVADPSPSTLTVNSNFLHLERRSGRQRVNLEYVQNVNEQSHQSTRLGRDL